MPLSVVSPIAMHGTTGNAVGYVGYSPSALTRWIAALCVNQMARASGYRGRERERERVEASE